MGRSRRHNPVITDQQRSHNVRLTKRLASKAARRVDLPDGKAYRRAFDSWEICDYKSAAWAWRGSCWERGDRRWTAK